MVSYKNVRDQKFIRTVETKNRGMVTTRLFAFPVYLLKQACDSRGGGFRSTCTRHLHELLEADQ